MFPLYIQNIGLIHKAIIQSGVDMNPWAQPAFKGVSYNRTRSFADQVKCKKDLLPTKWDQTMECLRETSAEALTLGFYALYVSIKSNLLYIFETHFFL